MNHLIIKVGVIVGIFFLSLTLSADSFATGGHHYSKSKWKSSKHYHSKKHYSYKKKWDYKKKWGYKKKHDDDDPDACEPEPPTEPPSNCSDCDGKLTNIIFRFDGLFTSFIEIEATKGHQTATLFARDVSTGDQFSVSGMDNFLDNKSTLGPNILIRVNGEDLGSLHTSCSEPVGPGTIIGDLVILAASSRNGGPTCPVGPIPDPPEEPCSLEEAEFCPPGSTPG